LTSPNVSNPAVSVNPKEQILSNPLPEAPNATQLIPVLLRRGEHEAFYHVATCGICGKPIIDFEAANVVVVGSDSAPQESLESLGTVDGAEIFRLGGIAVAVHLTCDKDGFTPWVRATSVFSRDQRGPIEKLGWTGVVGS